MSIAEQSKDPASSGGQLAERYAEGDIVAGKYALIRKLGSGGMGDVWLAHNRALDCRVAIKFISAEFALTEAAEAGLVEQLLEEARASAGLDHPAIVRVFDFGRTSKGDPMIVMQYLEGEDLATALETH